MKNIFKYITVAAAVIILMITGGCSTQKNTAKSRWWQAFNARYNTYYNGNMAFADGCIEKENGNKDDYTSILPLYTVGNKSNKETGKGNFDRAIEKCEKAIKRHSIKKRPEWNKSRKKTERDREWLSRREYNPFLWKAWLLMGKSQFQKGAFDEAAATFSYMSRLYQTQPSIYSLTRSWLARCYTELEWYYDAEDVITKMKRDSITRNAMTSWAGTLADFHIRRGNYAEAIPYLKQVIKHERRRKQKAREWFLMGQLENELGHKELAYKAFKKVVRQNPPYETAFNARIAQTEVMAKGRSKQMISKLRRMAASDNNKDYLDQVYYAIGNIYLLRRDTMQAITAYEKGAKEATRSGTEKGVLLLNLGNLYWEKEKYSDAKRCYGEAIGLLDKDRKGYKELSDRSTVLDELVPYTDAIHLQDSLQVLAKMPEAERNKAIDRVIEALKKKEKEEKKAAEQAELDQRQQGGNENTLRNNNQKKNTATTGMQSGEWYFYNQSAVSQGKTAFQKIWGKRKNEDNWQRINKTVVALDNASGGTEQNDTANIANNEGKGDQANADSTKSQSDTLANDPHHREFYLAQIPFTEDQLKESNNTIKEGLYNSGVIFKDKLNNLKLSEKAFTRLITQYPDYETMADVYYHMFLLYSRMGKSNIADSYVDRLKKEYPTNEWTTLLSDPNYAENARFGIHIEDSLYAATYDAFKSERFDEVGTNTEISTKRFPSGLNRPKFLFIDGLRKLDIGDTKGCITSMNDVVSKFPQSEVSTMAGMIIKGVKAGRTLHGGKFDIGNIWERRQFTLSDSDSIQAADTLSTERNTDFIFMAAYADYSVNENQMLYNLARYNFTNFMVRNFDISIVHNEGVSQMMVTGFLSYDEALQYARQLFANKSMKENFDSTRVFIISKHNLALIGTRYSYKDYEDFYDKTFAPLKISNEQLLDVPEDIVHPKTENDDYRMPAGKSAESKTQEDKSSQQTGNEDKTKTNEDDEFLNGLGGMKPNNPTPESSTTTTDSEFNPDNGIKPASAKKSAADTKGQPAAKQKTETKQNTAPTQKQETKQNNQTDEFDDFDNISPKNQNEQINQEVKKQEEDEFIP